MFKNSFLSPSGMAMSAAVAAVIMVLIIPLPPWSLDVFIAISFSASLSMLMVVLNISRPLLFSSFPSFLLLVTVLRLAVSLATTRSILGFGHAGQIVQTFGEIVTAGNIFVGVVLFGLVTVVQMLVITKGAERVAEVAARFTLDSLPGRQMSIDADLRSGTATLEEVKIRREEIQRESELYGALDGAMKFVKGDALATLIFVIVNMIGGIIIATMQLGQTLAQATENYTILTIGDGLSAQLPSLLTSITAGLVVARVRSSQGNASLGEQIIGEFYAQPQGLAAAGLLTIIGLMPGAPTIVFLTLGLGLGVSSFFSFRTINQERSVSVPEAQEGDEEGQSDLTPASKSRAKAKFKIVPVRPITVEHNCIGFVKNAREIDKSIEIGRRKLYFDTGIPFPPIHVVQNQNHKEGDASVYINELQCGKFQMLKGHVMVPVRMYHLTTREKLQDIIPALGGEASWVPEKYRQKLRSLGISTFSPEGAFSELVCREIKLSAGKLIGIQRVKEILAECEIHYPDLTKEMLKAVPLARFTDVLQRLINEDVSIRDIESIMNGLVEHGNREKDTVILTELLRGYLRRQICMKIMSGRTTIPAFTCSADLENLITESISEGPSESFLNLTRGKFDEILEEVRKAIGSLANRPSNPIIFTSPDIRRHFKRLIDKEYPTIPVLSTSEIVPELTFRVVGEIECPQQEAHDN